MINRKWSYFSSAWTLDWLPANTLHIQTEHCRAANSSVLRQDCVNIDNLLEFPVRQCIQNLFFCQNFNFYSCTVIFPWSEGEIKNIHIYIHLALVKDDPSMSTSQQVLAPCFSCNLVEGHTISCETWSCFLCFLGNSATLRCCARPASAVWGGSCQEDNGNPHRARAPWKYLVLHQG